jgi:DNA-binding transcriptional LysR family regulator
MRWRLDDLAIFCAVLDAGGVSGAALRLALPKSSVSKHLARLEQDLGLRLIERSSRRMRVTPEGEAFHQRASLILDLAHEADATMQGLRAQPAGRVALAVPAAFCREILTPHLPDFVARHPAIELELMITTQPVDLISGLCDMAVVVGPQPDSGLSHKALLGGRLIWVASPAYAGRHGIGPDSPEDFAHLAVCESRYAAAPLALHSHGEARRVPVGRHVVRINDPLCVRDAVQSGMGVAPLPERYCHKALADGTLVEVWKHVLIDHEAARMALIYPGNRLLSPRFRAVIDFLEQVCQRHPMAG